MYLPNDATLAIDTSTVAALVGVIVVATNIVMKLVDALVARVRKHSNGDDDGLGATRRSRDAEMIGNMAKIERIMASSQSAMESVASTTVNLTILQERIVATQTQLLTALKDSHERIERTICTGDNRVESAINELARELRDKRGQ